MKFTVSLFVVAATCISLLSSANACATPLSHVQSLQPIDLLELASVEYTFTPAAMGLAITDKQSGLAQCHDHAEDDAIALAAIGRHDPFGKAGSMRLNFHGGFGNDIKTSDNQFGLLGAGISYFIIENLSLDLELNGLYIDQRGSDAWAVNLNLLFRWHFFSQETWSIYLDGGAGLFGATKRVPSNGTHFNFTPQAGGGVSFEIAPDLRLMAGLRWHHISNARTSRNNPGRDHVFGYVGISMPF